MMNSFDTRFLHYWAVTAQGRLFLDQPTFQVSEHPSQSSVELLCVDGIFHARVGAEVANELDWSQIGDPEEFRAALVADGVRLNDPDVVFGSAQNAFSQIAEPSTRLLTANDAEAFSAFTENIDEAELDEAFVELDHWAVVGVFDEDYIVAAASAYPWQESRELADLGVITHPDHRGRGHATRAVKAVAAELDRRGFASHYRCQLDNAASQATARAAGFERYGTWEVALEPFTL